MNKTTITKIIESVEILGATGIVTTGMVAIIPVITVWGTVKKCMEVIEVGLKAGIHEVKTIWIDEEETKEESENEEERKKIEEIEEWFSDPDNQEEMRKAGQDIANAILNLNPTES